MENRNQLSSICQLLCKSGLIINTDMSVIPCNGMHEIELGKYGHDFNNENEFIDFWNRKEIIDFYDSIRTLPSFECINCKLYSKCGGGCIAQWFNYSYEELIEFQQKYYL